MRTQFYRKRFLRFECELRDIVNLFLNGIHSSNSDSVITKRGKEAKCLLNLTLKPYR